jgi:hypothetical protein
MTNNICVVQKDFYVERTLFGRLFDTQVGHQLAATMLTKQSRHSVGDLFTTCQNARLNNELLKSITSQYSLGVFTFGTKIIRNNHV